MAATFDPTLANHRDHIRLLLGDRHNSASTGTVVNALLQDEVIDANLTEFGFREALARLADALAADAAQQMTQYQEENGVRSTWGSRLTVWQQLAKQARGGLIPVPGSSKIPRTFAAVGLLTIQNTVDPYYRGD